MNQITDVTKHKRLHNKILELAAKHDYLELEFKPGETIGGSRVAWDLFVWSNSTSNLESALTALEAKSKVS